MFDAMDMAAIAATFLLAGAVKGVVGLGLPTVALGLLTAVLGLPTAMALLIVPSFVTNVWQAASGGNGRRILARIWPFLLVAVATVSLGATALTRLDHAILSGLLGVVLLAYAAVALAGFRPAMPARREVWAGPLLGAANGVLTGMTGTFVVPSVMFLQAIGLSKDMLVQAMGILFAALTAALALALGTNGLMSPSLGAASAAALVPALIGMAAGRRIRMRLSEARFRQVFFAAIAVLGLYVLTDAAV